MAARMNGAESLIRTLVNSDVDVCFTNPGTSEMHLVHAIDRVEGMRPVLGLFEGVVTGAADGYARMTGKPAATLLHLGPGFGNGWANLHNARRARVPMVNVVGDHATYHAALDAPLASDIEGVAKPVSGWVRSIASASEVGPVTAEAVSASREYPGQIATVIMPADCAWTELPEGEGAHAVASAPEAPQVAGNTLGAVADALKKAKRPIFLLGTPAVLEDPLEDAGRIANACGVEIFCDTFTARLQKGAGRVPTTRLPYFGEMALDALAGVDLMVLVGTQEPAAFFAYPNKPSRLVPEGCTVMTLAEPHEDAPGALQALAELMNAPAEPARRAEPMRPDLPTGKLTPGAIGHAVGHLLPEGAIVSDESVSAGLGVEALTAGAPPHDWLYLTGGSIGQGLPAATGAAIACPDRKVVSLEGDGSAMYTIQALWTQARENLDVVTVIFANRSYTILNIEFDRVGAGAPGAKAESMLSIGNPDMDFVKIANGLGVEAKRVDTAEAFADVFAHAMKRKGPFLIEALI
jgi:acetolactate synthase-1/2/3 large subunit